MSNTETITITVRGTTLNLLCSWWYDPGCWRTANGDGWPPDGGIELAQDVPEGFTEDEIYEELDKIDPGKLHYAKLP